MGASKTAGRNPVCRESDAFHSNLATIDGSVGSALPASCACATTIHDAQCGSQDPKQTCTFDDGDTKCCQCGMNGLGTTLEAQENLLLEKIDAYYQWMREDHRVAGIVPWHVRHLLWELSHALS